jgi:hydrogenase-4 component B
MAVLGEGLILAGLLLAAGLTDAPLLPLLAELPGPSPSPPTAT